MDILYIIYLITNQVFFSCNIYIIIIIYMYILLLLYIYIT